MKFKKVKGKYNSEIIDGWLRINIYKPHNRWLVKIYSIYKITGRKEKRIYNLWEKWFYRNSWGTKTEMINSLIDKLPIFQTCKPVIEIRKQRIKNLIAD